MVRVGIGDGVAGTGLVALGTSRDEVGTRVVEVAGRARGGI